MKLPPEATYDDVNTLKVAYVHHVVIHLYSVTINQSDYKMGIIFLHYGKSGIRDDRHVGSMMLCVKCQKHNHPSLTREMINDMKEYVWTLSAVGVASTQILTLIRSEPSGEHVIARDIYNLKRQHIIKRLDGWMSIETLIPFLIVLDVSNTHCVDASGHLTRLPFTSNKAVQLTRRLGTMLTMDCTYKSNMFKMPLLHITIEYYEYALNAYKGFMSNYLPFAIVIDRELALMRTTKIDVSVVHKMFC
ncbi:hypothetical protein MPTK1_7g09320 [Marchantia polymorpha subsp. ruderalis]|uniref:MULE transposase domain-containing protein n=2 Tax=Marchantia polymorpha TaxID=3197 RepID=A0AAF6BXR0_MARPO|nr:hypothetical protein MARPO_0068s0085 [Marchantia polymorpha]BBN16794.1 hypothetical protein Mp_7g09320 [Marchantia polymorpha subsp. ruderalis]|eukprot:PTQ35877.1 hypothetical protein MARPO_0068s0085 [Marchantia polymorpha]